MEKNGIYNSKIKQMIANKAIELLLSRKDIDKADLPNVKIFFGYLYSNNKGSLVALFCLTVSKDKSYYFSVQDNALSLVNINKILFDQTVATMKTLHPCLNENISETQSQLERKLKNNKFLETHGISFANSLTCLYEDENVKIKSIDEVCKRAIACIIMVQIACDIRNNSYEESKEFFVPLLKKFNVEDCLNSKEKRILDGTYTKQDVIDMDWAYETYWALCWFLGLVEDISNSSEICDCSLATSFVIDSDSFDDFKNKCTPRIIHELLDMHDLYYRYHWAINEKHTNPNANIGNINSSIVLERRRALEWILSNESDWYNLRLNA